MAKPTLAVNFSRNPFEAMKAALADGRRARVPRSALRLGRIGLNENDGELIAAVAKGRIDLANALEENFSHFAQHRAAHQVSVGVVDLLEKVQI